MNNSVDFSPRAGEQIVVVVKAGLIMGVVLGLFSTLFSGVNIGIILGLVATTFTAVAFGFISLTLSSASARDSSKFMSLKLSEDEQIIGEGAGNHMENNKGVGGKIVFTNLGVHFVAHKWLGNDKGVIPLFVPYKSMEKIFLRSVGIFSSLLSGSSVSQLVISSQHKEDIFNIYRGEKMRDFLFSKINH